MNANDCRIDFATAAKSGATHVYTRNSFPSRASLARLARFYANIYGTLLPDISLSPRYCAAALTQRRRIIAPPGWDRKSERKNEACAVYRPEEIFIVALK